MTEPAAPRPARLQSAVALRALATVFVVVIHTTHWPPSASLFDGLDTLSRFAVPAFMLLTGVLLSYQYGGRRLSTSDFLRRRFSRSLVPWLAWAPVYAVFGWFFSTDPQHSVTGVVNFLIYGAGHLWFLLLIPQMYLVYLVWPRRHLWWWAAGALALQTALCVYRLYGPMPIGVDQLFLWHGFQLLAFWIGYFAVGVAAGRTLLGRGEPSQLHWLPVVGAAAVVAISGWLMIAVSYGGAPHGDFQVGTGAFLLPQEPLFVLAIAVLVWLVGGPLLSVGGPMARGIAVLSDNSLGIYILHPIVVFAIGRQISGLLNPGLPLSFVGFLVLTLGGLVAATLASLLLRATPLAVSLGVSRRPPSRPGARAASPRSAAG
ncbi:MAG TPA: acyltransferase [Candidatus Dormibacteraeota bacterium]|jgi:surface polysaccharide O-acyltransferase-like enzyme